MNVARLTAIALALSTVCRPASADDASAISGKIATAAAFVKSFVIEMQLNGTTGVGGTTTIIRPANVKSEMKIGQMAVETYLIGNTVYMHTPMAGWQKTTVDLQHPPQQTLDIVSMIAKAHTTLLPDRQENGVTVGVLRIESPIPPSAAPMIQQAANLVCTYDKKSYLLRTCANGMMTMKYTKFNDPANVVVLPDEAKNAVPVVIRTPAAAAPVATGTPGAMNQIPAPVDSPMTLRPAPLDSPSPVGAPTATPAP